eukprot:COSAG01_NODE_71491_length_255_cov_2.320513_1_plen_34_part_01
MPTFEACWRCLAAIAAVTRCYQLIWGTNLSVLSS